MLKNIGFHHHSKFEFRNLGFHQKKTMGLKPKLGFHKTWREIGEEEGSCLNSWREIGERKVLEIRRRRG